MGRAATARQAPVKRAPARRRPAPAPARKRRAGAHPKSRAAARPRGARILDTLLTGRACIAVVGVLLAGIVFFNVDLLQMNRDITKMADRAAQLKRENARLRLDLARLASSERIQETAAGLGLVLPAPGEVRYLRSRPPIDAKNASKHISAPDSTYVPPDPATSAPDPAGSAPRIPRPARPTRPRRRPVARRRPIPPLEAPRHPVRWIPRPASPWIRPPAGRCTRPPARPSILRPGYR